MLWFSSEAGTNTISAWQVRNDVYIISILPLVWFSVWFIYNYSYKFCFVISPPPPNKVTIVMPLSHTWLHVCIQHIVMPLSHTWLHVCIQHIVMPLSHTWLHVCIQHIVMPLSHTWLHVYNNVWFSPVSIPGLYYFFNVLFCFDLFCFSLFGCFFPVFLLSPSPCYNTYILRERESVSNYYYY
jgi:hypothetical protein